MSARLSTEERRAGIVASILKLANDTSPALITTHDVASAVGVTQGAVFKHFASKEAIWQAAMQWVRTTLMSALNQAAHVAPTPCEALSALFRTHVGFVWAHPGVPRVIFHELQQPHDTAAKEEVRALLQEYRALLMTLLAQARDAGQVPDTLDLDAAATAFVGLIQGLVMQAMLSGPAPVAQGHADRVFKIYLRGLGVQP